MEIFIYVGTYVCMHACTYICIYLYKDTGWAVRSSSPDRGKILFSPPNVQTGGGAQPASVYFPGTKCQGVMLTTHRHLVPRLRTSGAVPLLPVPRLRTSGAVRLLPVPRLRTSGAVPLLPVPRLRTSGAVPLLPYTPPWRG